MIVGELTRLSGAIFLPVSFMLTSSPASLLAMCISTMLCGIRTLDSRNRAQRPLVSVSSTSVHP